MLQKYDLDILYFHLQQVTATTFSGKIKDDDLI
jgi:hypothetical protein